MDVPCPIIDYGVVNFVRNRREAKADFMRVVQNAPSRNLLRFLVKQWRLKQPGIVLQITGSAQGFDLPANLVTPITEGIVAAASVAEAWVITGGFDAGVMSLVGSSVARWKHKCDKTPLLGIGSWRAVQNNERLENACGERVDYFSAGRNTGSHAGLEPNHTHFLLVDSPDDVPKGFGAEHELLAELQGELRRVYGAPTVLLVIQGGPGTLDTLMGALRQGIVTVLAADSGKIASAIAHYMRTGDVPSEYAKHTTKFEEIRELNRRAASTDELEGTFNDEWPLVSLFYLRGRDHIGEAVLTAVLKQSKLEARLRFAVAWNRADLLEAQLSAIPSWQESRSNVLRDVLQLALELERPEMVKAALHHGAPAKEVDLFALYAKLTEPLTCKYPLFYSDEQPAVLTDRKPLAYPDMHKGSDGRRAPAAYYRMFFEDVADVARKAVVLNRWGTGVYAGVENEPANAYQRLPSPPSSPPPSPPVDNGAFRPPKPRQHPEQRPVPRRSAAATRSAHAHVPAAAQLPPPGPLPAPTAGGGARPPPPSTMSDQAAATAVYWREQQEEQRRSYERQQLQIQYTRCSKRGMRDVDAGVDVAQDALDRGSAMEAVWADLKDAAWAGAEVRAYEMRRLRPNGKRSESSPPPLGPPSAALGASDWPAKPRNARPPASALSHATSACEAAETTSRNAIEDGSEVAEEAVVTLESRATRYDKAASRDSAPSVAKPEQLTHLDSACGELREQRRRPLPEEPEREAAIPRAAPRAAPRDGERLLRVKMPRDEHVGVRGGIEGAVRRTGEAPAHRALTDPMSETLAAGYPAQFYPRDVWRFLGEVIPGLHLYWSHKILQYANGQKAKLSISALDLYIWAILLGNTDLAMVLLGTCQDPMRAAILGARVCNHMAEVLPIESEALEGAAEQHESFAIALLDLCANQNDARCMLLTPARHWNRNVLELAVHSDMKRFISHRHVQNLTSLYLHGDVDAALHGGTGDREAAFMSHAMLPVRFAREPLSTDWLLIMAHAVCPCILKLRRAPRATRQPVCIDFYTIPYVKQVLRMVLYQVYVGLFSCVTMSRKIPSINMYLGQYGLKSEYMLLVWTGSLILDEWNQWVVNPRTFVVDLWNGYDYVALSLTTVGLLMKLGVTHVNRTLDGVGLSVLADDSHAAGRVLRGGGGGSSGLGGFSSYWSGDSDSSWLLDIDNNLLAVVNVLVWCRVLQHYSTQREIGVLIIMIINMLTDMKIWILLSAIFTAAFSVTFISVNTDDARDDSVVQSITGALWAMYGEFYIDFFREASGVLGEVLLWVFAMISNVLLVNLLIAMMSDTFQKIKEKADIEWKFGRVSSVLEVVERTHPMPPPFSAPLMLYRFVGWAILTLLQHACPNLNLARATQRHQQDTNDWATGGRLNKLKRRRAEIAKATLQAYRRHDDEQTEVSGDGRLRRIEKLVLDLLIFSEDQERELKFLRQEVLPERQEATRTTTAVEQRL